MLKNVKLGTKIASVPLIVLLLLVFSGTVTYLQLQRIETDVRDITDDLAPDAKKAAGLLQNILEKRLVVRAYLKAGDDRFIARFHDLEKENNQLMQAAQHSIHHPVRVKLLDDIHHLDEQYSKAFATDVVANMEKRQQVMRDVMDVQGPFIEKTVTAINETAFRDNDPVAAHHAAVTLRHFLLARLYLFKYLEDNEDADAKRVVEELRAAEEESKRMDAELENAQRKQWSQAALQALERYEQGFTAIITAIEARNKAVQTILDVNGPKIAEDANTLEESVWHDLKKDGEDVHYRIATTDTTLLVVTLVAVLLGGSLAVVICRMITTPLQVAVGVAKRLAAGDMTVTVDVTSRDETGQLMRAMQTMSEKLRQMVGEIRQGSASITTAAREISQGNADLSQRTQAQAAALEETAASMEQMTSAVRHNADNARQANQLAAGACAQVEQGGEVMRQAVTAMGEINSRSKKIADIIGVIDSIAFQTNLLALNAAVEAARAGEQGRGFAVVAAEVRRLAQRSAEAAKDIKALITDSVEKVGDGTRLVDASGQTLEAIVTAVKQVSEIVAAIATASQEQSSGIEQVNKAIMQMDEVTQQNAALVEEASAASESLDGQAQTLKQLMGFFKVDDHVMEQGAAVAHASEGQAPASLPVMARQQDMQQRRNNGYHRPVATGSGTDSWQ